MCRGVAAVRRYRRPFINLHAQALDLMVRAGGNFIHVSPLKRSAVHKSRTAGVALPSMISAMTSRLHP